MLCKHITRIIVFLSLAVGSAGTAPAANYSLCGNSGGQLHIGDGLMLPLQAAASAATTGTVFPTLLIPLVAGASSVTGTLAKPLLTAMATPVGPVTKSGYQRKLSVPVGVLSKPAAQETLGVKAYNPSVFAVGTNLNYKWPAASAVFSTGAAVTTTTVVGHGGTVVYSNTLGARFGGPASFALSPGAPAGLIPGAPVTIYLKINGTTPACTHPALGGAGAGCVAGLLPAMPTGLAGPGGPTAVSITTPGGAAAPNIAAVKLGASPLGTVISAVAAATTPLPTNMATSQPAPWTTGKVVISNPAVGEKFTLSGKDSRTALGAGNIQLVSGALSTRVASGANANRGWIQLELKPVAAPTSKQTFKIVGNSNGIAWSWRIDIGGSTFASATAVGPVPPAGTPPAFASAFISSVNSNSGMSGCSASATANSDEFEVACTCDFVFYVADAAGTGGICEVSGTLGGSGCSFNPTIVQVGSSIPMLGTGALLVLSSLLLAMFLLFAGIQRSPN